MKPLQNSIEEEIKKLETNFVFANIVGSHKELIDAISQSLHRIAKIERNNVVKEIRDGFLKRGKENGKDTILWTAPEIVEVMDKILDLPEYKLK